LAIPQKLAHDHAKAIPALEDARRVSKGVLREGIRKGVSFMQEKGGLTRVY